MIAVVLVCIALFYAAKIEYETGVYECRKCGHTFNAYIWGAHTLTTRLFKCPECEEKSWCKRKSVEKIGENFMSEKGFFGGLFDFNNDGKLDSFERAADFGMFVNMMEESEKQEKADEISSAGLDFDELEYMDEDERREALEDAGLDSDDFDFD